MHVNQIILKMQIKKSQWGGCGGCEPRIEVILKMQKKLGWGWGVRWGWMWTKIKEIGSQRIS